jgi:DNA-directed RNA polymerase specialized sigma24 family protein
VSLRVSCRSRKAEGRKREYRKRCGASGLSRDYCAEFLVANEALVRRRIRHKLNAARQARRVSDTDDLLSDLTIRLDDLSRRGALRATGDAELSSLLGTMADRALLDKLRSAGRIGRRSERTGTVESLASAVQDSALTELVRMLESLPNGNDREVMRLKLLSTSDAAIAGACKTTAAAIRQRWSRICRDLRTRFPEASEMLPSRSQRGSSEPDHDLRPTSCGAGAGRPCPRRAPGGRASPAGTPSRSGSSIP